MVVDCLWYGPSVAAGFIFEQDSDPRGVLPP